MEQSNLNKAVNIIILLLFVLGLVFTMIFPFIQPENVVNFMRNIINIVIWLTGFYTTVLTIGLGNELLDIKKDAKPLTTSMFLVVSSLSLLWTSNAMFLSGEIILSLRALMAALLMSLFALLNLLAWIVYRHTSPFKIGFAFVRLR